MSVNGARRSKLEQGRHSWQWVKHAWLYSDLLQALQGEHSPALDSQQRGLNFCFRSTPLSTSTFSDLQCGLPICGVFFFFLFLLLLLSLFLCCCSFVFLFKTSYRIGLSHGCVSALLLQVTFVALRSNCSRFRSRLLED